MRFSWTGLILAPLLVPLLFCAVMSSPLTNGSVPFLILLVPCCMVSYGTTICLFLPSLFLLSWRRPMTGLKVCLLGLILGAVVFVPLTLMAWKGSGPDSGPPIESFWVFFLRWAGARRRHAPTRRRMTRPWHASCTPCKEVKEVNNFYRLCPGRHRGDRAGLRSPPGHQRRFKRKPRTSTSPRFRTFRCVAPLGDQIG